MIDTEKAREMRALGTAGERLDRRGLAAHNPIGMAKSTYAGTLLGALRKESGSPRLRAAAAADVADALSNAATWGDIADALGVSRDTIERMRDEFPWLFEGFQKSTENRT